MTSAPPLTSPTRDSWRTIVVGYDGSASAARAVAFAMDLAARTGAEVRLVHAVEDPGDVVQPETDEAIRSRHRVDEEVLADMIREGEHRGVRIQGAILEGPPVATLLKVASDEGANLIVVGTRGLRGAAKVLMGSVSSGVVAGAKVPVTVVH